MVQEGRGPRIKLLKPVALPMSLDPHQCSRLGKVLSALNKGLSKPDLPLAGTDLLAQPYHAISQTTKFSSTSSDHLVAGTLCKVGLWTEDLGKRGQMAPASSFFPYRQNSHTWDFKREQTEEKTKHKDLDSVSDFEVHKIKLNLEKARILSQL